MINLGVPVEAVHSGHGEHGHDDVGPGTIGAFSFAFPFDPDTVRVELVKGTTLLYAAGQTATPVIERVEVVPEILVPRSRASSSIDASTDSLVAASGGPGAHVSGDVVTTAAVGTASLEGDNYVFNGEGGYSADGLGQNGTGGNDPGGRAGRLDG